MGRECRYGLTKSNSKYARSMATWSNEHVLLAAFEHKQQSYKNIISILVRLFIDPNLKYSTEHVLLFSVGLYYLPRLQYSSRCWARSQLVSDEMWFALALYAAICLLHRASRRISELLKHGHREYCAPGTAPPGGQTRVRDHNQCRNGRPS